MGLPFDGIRIIDFSWWGVGPMIVRHLADYGAEIIKVETGTHMDAIRFAMATSAKEGVPGVNRSGWWAALNHGRMGITLNLKRPEAQAVARKLVAIADVVNENYTTGAMDELGVGYGELVKVKPDIIMMSANIFGQSGPAARHPGTGGVGMTMGLFSHYTGFPDRGPTPASGGTAGSDFTSPQLGAAALIAALDYRRRTGKGQHIDLSQLEATFPYFGPAILDYTVNGREGEKMGNRSTWAAPHGVFPCAGDDRWIAIACESDGHWEALKGAMGNPRWAHDPVLDTVLGRLENQDELEGRIGEWTAQFEPFELMERLQRAGVPAGVVENAADLMADRQLNHRQHFVYLEHPEIGTQAYESRSYRLSRTPGWPTMPGPTLGQHNDYVFTELLGLSGSEVEDLIAIGAIA